MPYRRVIIEQDVHIQHQFQQQDFDIERWQSIPGSEVLAGGRGASQKIVIDQQALVLRRYLRGGFMARLLKDLYLWTGIRQTRPWREREVVQYALQQGLPLAPVSAFNVQRNLFFYRAAIISRYLPNQGTLASCLYEAEIEETQWHELGNLIKNMHRSGINHADLNANNILIGEQQDFYLIDFDKARIMQGTGAWAENNLNRLLRSLNKIKHSRSEQGLAFNFSSQHWAAFLSGYR
jgi:3-deoxy-D-manno-octulosonic acid kinase